jgi:hypothetical protein
MKEKDLKVDFKEQEVVLYVEKEDQSYGAMVTGSYAAKNYLDDYFSKQKNLEKELKDDLKNGKISPVYFFMKMQDMGIGDLAKRIGVSKRKLRKHFDPAGFKKLDEAMLQKYAVVFGISVDVLKSLEQRA